MPNFADVTGMAIPEGEVIKITAGSTVLWEKSTDITLPDTDYSGEIDADMSETVELYAGAEVTEDIRNLYIIRKTASTDANVVNQISGKNVTVGSGTTYYSAIQISAIEIESSRYYDGIEITLDASTTLYFDGEYYWGFDEG